MTAAAFCEYVGRPEHRSVSFELVRGHLLELPPTGPRHARARRAAAHPLVRYVDAQGHGFVSIHGSDVILEQNPATVRRPDVALFEDCDLASEYDSVLPTLVVDVLTPGRRASAFLQRVTDFLRGGVPLVWVVDPVPLSVTAFSADSGPRVYTGDETLTGGEVVPELVCRASDFFWLAGR